MLSPCFKIMQEIFYEEHEVASCDCYVMYSLTLCFAIKMFTTLSFNHLFFQLYLVDSC